MKYEYKKVTGYEQKKFTENGHTMFEDDVLRRLKRLSYLEEEYKKLNGLNTEKNECNSPVTEIEQPYFDKKGKEIKEFSVLKVYHFFGVNDQGRGRKHHYMYKWVCLEEYKGKKYWSALHLTNGDGGKFRLRAIADKQTRKLMGVEIVQQY